MTHYTKYKTLISSNQQIRRQRNKEYNIQQMTPCAHCGYFHPAAMDWHHKEPSTKRKGGVSQLVRGGARLELIQEEIDKCICLCSNCHRILHQGD